MDFGLKILPQGIKSKSSSCNQLLDVLANSELLIASLQLTNQANLQLIGFISDKMAFPRAFSHSDIFLWTLQILAALANPH